MQKHKTHQIDDQAQQIMRSTLPMTWVANEQQKDYGKDFLIEIGDKNGFLSGESFIVQLKGQGKVQFIDNGERITFSLKSKYSRYYYDKVKDLPVFLVVVDVKRKKGWWIFLQPVLQSHQSWRHKNSMAIRLPVENELTDSGRLESAILEAKKWMRIQHPESIEDAVAGQKQRLMGIDPRFNILVSLNKNEKPHFEFRAIEDVEIKMQFQGNVAIEKVRDLIDKGEKAEFQLNEVTISGSPLFEQYTKGTLSIHSNFNHPGAINLACYDGKNELARLYGLDGSYFGGEKEFHFQGDLPKCPISYRIGPFSWDGGPIPARFDFDYNRWDGQELSRLAYFDRLFNFFTALPKALSTFVEFEKEGNVIHKQPLPLSGESFVSQLAAFFEMINISRRIADHYNMDRPTWSTERFDDQDEIETIDVLFGLAFENGWESRKPDLEIIAECNAAQFDMPSFKRAKQPTQARLAHVDAKYSLFGQEVHVGDIAEDYFAVNTKIIDQDAEKVTIAISGTPHTIKRITKIESSVEDAMKELKNPGFTTDCNVIENNS